jgi:putative transposase
MSARRGWINVSADLSIKRQTELLHMNRSTVYYSTVQTTYLDEEDEVLRQLIDKVYGLYPFYGTRRMAVHLREQGYLINRKRVQRLMREMGLRGMAPGPDTSKPHPEHKTYPYLLRGVEINAPNHVWGTDITYIRLGKGFVYLVAVMDWYSRQVLSWRISNTMDSQFCVECLEDALKKYGNPMIFNSDQGSQFTSHAFTDVLKREGIAISMDGRGRALDNIYVERLWRNVKYEDIYLRGYESMSELLMGLTRYFAYYNHQRPHQSLAYKTPNAVFQTGFDGGAYIPDKFSNAKTGNNPKTVQPCLVAVGE